MVQDALDPGPSGDYPAWPRLADGSPDAERMPTGLHLQRAADGTQMLVDVTPRDENGDPIVPPTIPPP